MRIHLVLEGYLEEPAADRLLAFCGLEKGTVYGRQGFGYILKKAHAFESLTRGGNGILVLTDFRDSGATCPPEALQRYLLCHNPNPSPLFLLRFAEHELESWLLADRETMAAFIGVSLKSVPSGPDKELKPKLTLVNLARKSRKRVIKNALVPPVGHGGLVGRDYLSTMTDFVVNHWRPEEAVSNSPSLKRCITRLQALAKKKD